MDLFINKNVSDKGTPLMFLFIPMAVVLTSFYLFPFEFSFAIGYNTKMIMAGVGLLLLLIQFAQKREFVIKRDLYTVFYWALIVSVCGLIAVAYNGTRDFTYSTYFVSMLVWLSAANVLISFLRFVHGYVSISLVCKYMIAVCVLQCISALIIDNYEPFKHIVNLYVANFSSSVSTSNSLDSAGRLYGIGAALDVAGSRFSVILVILSYLLLNKIKSKRGIILYLLCFVFIVIVGCSIGRTTMIGAVLAIVYWVYALRRNSDINIEYKRFLLIGIIVLIVTIPIIIYLYYNNAAFNSSMRFAFEGFFNYSETGTWRTSSTDILKTMYIFPENIKTWFIGDGYFADPSVFDPYFIGKSYSAFYMGIDVGYLRFIYYFGLLGLIAFIVYFVKVTCLCINRFPDYKILFFLIVSINFIIWFKVSTDIFLVFALFLCIDKKDNNYLENKIVSNNQ